MNSSNKNRIIFLDLMRAFAVLMMVQGHTVHTFLSGDLRTSESLFYTVWHFMRGFTAPIFMFTAGVVFTYLLFYNKSSISGNPRVLKGIKRFFLLVGLGYILRYPTHTVIDFSDVTEERWLIFFGVDALHLIGFGLLFIIIFSYIAEKVKIKPYYTLGGAALLFFMLYPPVSSVEWRYFLPLPVAAYFYTDTGSLFPFFPWAGYVLAGSLLGYFLSQHELVFRTKKFGIYLIVLGSGLFSVYLIVSGISQLSNTDYGNSINSLTTIMLRTGYVIFISGLFSLVALKYHNIPNIIKLTGRHTLLIYVVHLIILYGSAWIPGLYDQYGETLNVFGTLLAVAVMFTLMFAMILAIEKLKNLRSNKFIEVQSITK